MIKGQFDWQMTANTLMRRKDEWNAKQEKHTLRIKARKNAKNKDQKGGEKRRKSNGTPPSAKGWRPHRTSRVSSCCLGITAQKNKKMTKPDSCELLQKWTEWRGKAAKEKKKNQKTKGRGIISKTNYVVVELPPLANVAPNLEFRNSNVPIKESRMPKKRGRISKKRRKKKKAKRNKS